MFCPNCGKAEQTENTFCRGCGEFLPDRNDWINKLSFGGNTPEEQINANLFLNLLSAVVSFLLAVSLYWTFGWRNGGAPVIIYIVAAFLLAMSGWQISTVGVGLKLKKNFKRRKEDGKIPAESAAPPTPENLFQSAQTKELLNEADLENIVPAAAASIIENTTKTFSEKIKNRSS